MEKRNKILLLIVIVIKYYLLFFIVIYIVIFSLFKLIKLDKILSVIVTKLFFFITFTIRDLFKKTFIYNIV